MKCKPSPLLPSPPSLWLRFVDDTFVINKAEHSQELLQHINNQDPHIQFTVEPHNRTHSPSWTLLSPSNQTTPSAPQFTENPPTQINIYTGTATTTSQPNKVSSTPWHIGPKQYHPPRPAWTRNWTTSKQPSYTVNSPPGPSINGITGSTSHNNNPTPPNNPSNNNSTDKPKIKATIVVPYIPNTSEKFKKVCKRKGIRVHFKGSNTLRTALGNPKDKDPKVNQTGIIYQYQCPHTNSTSAYIGESGRTLGDRIKEHFKAPSPIHLHSSTTGHPMDPNQLCTRKSTAIPGPSRRLCSYVFRTPH